MTLFRKIFFNNYYTTILNNKVTALLSLSSSPISRFQIKRDFSSDKPRGTRGVVLGCYEPDENSEEPKLTPCAEKFNAGVSGKLTELIKEFRISGKVGKGKIFCNIHPDYKQVAIVGVGKSGVGYNEIEILQEGRENVRIATGVGARKLQEQGCIQICVDPMEYPEQAAVGANLGIFRYQDNRQKKDRILTPQVEPFECADTDSWTRGVFKAEAQNLARKLTDAPGNQMTPTCFAQAAVDALCPCGIIVEVRTMDWIETHHLHSFLTIARSSCEPPVFLEINYCGAPPEDKPILLIGKGITYDSGGICLKKDKMEFWRSSMGGAAVVVSTIRAAAALSLPINIIALVPLCENMPSGMAVRAGDVITCLDGKNLCIEDTSCAGVVCLADTLCYGYQYFKPKMVIDVASTGDGVRYAFGGACSGVFSSSNFLWKQLQIAGALSGDRVWRMPLWNYYKEKITNYNSYDVNNKGVGPASSCLAAACLREFIPCADWMHIDISGVTLACCDSLPYLMEGQMTGRPTRTLIQFLYQLACPEVQLKDLRDT